MILDDLRFNKVRLPSLWNEGILQGHTSTQVGAFALVGMGAVFAGVIRAPITSVLIILEMTAGYGLVLPLMLANMTAYMLARKARPTPIYEALLEQDGVHLPVAHRMRHAIETLRVSDAMTREVLAIRSPGIPLDRATTLRAGRYSILPVVDETEVVTGVVRVAEASASPDDALPVHPADLVRSSEPLPRAVVRMTDLGVRQLVVVGPGGELAGILAMSDVVRAHGHALRGFEDPLADGEEPGASTRAGKLMVPAIVVPPSSTLVELAGMIRREGPRGLVIASVTGFRAVPPRQVEELLEDEDLARVLVAADLAQPARAIPEGDDLRSIASALGDDLDILVVVRAAVGPVGVLTREAVAQAVLRGFMRRELQA